jgi:GNAT superfamily N-acetyltransferase
LTAAELAPVPIVREETPDDLPAVVELRNRANPWEPPETLERARHREATRDPSLPILHLVAEHGGAIVAAGSAGAHAWFPRHIIGLGINVDPAWQRRGIGSAVLDRLTVFARQHGTDLMSIVSEQSAAAVAFARHHGFEERYRLIEMSLAVGAFDFSPYEGLRQQLSNQGIRLTKLASQGRSEARRAAYDLWANLWRQIPNPDQFQIGTFERWTKEVLEGPAANLESFVLADVRGHYVGLAYMTTPPGRPAYSLFTGVLPEYRGRKIALALKVETIRYARDHGIAAILTNNNTTNPPMIAVNERLGFRRLPSRIRFGRAP